MGQEASTPIDDSTPPKTLKSRTLPSLAKYINSEKCKNIVVMTGAGISTSAGIPDFRSPDTGLYANLARLNLPYAEAVFSIGYFREHPEPFYTLAHELYPGKFRPTITHCFIALLERKGLLLKHFTQNIDCLDREAGVPGEKVVEAHGSFATQRCIECKREFPGDEMRDIIAKKEIPRCKDTSCNGLVKPDIVFFGEQLPAEFFANRALPAQADLAIVLGTSLTVQPFASLPGFVREEVPRLLVNLETVGDLGCRADDVIVLGDCDGGIRKLAEEVGWLEELEEMWEEIGVRYGAEKREKKKVVDGEKKSKDEKFESEVEKLTREVEQTLKLTESHRDRVERDLGEGKVKEEVKEEIKNEGEKNSLSAPVTTKEEESEKIAEKADSGEQPEGGGLSHVFPNLKDKSSL